MARWLRAVAAALAVGLACCVFGLEAGNAEAAFGMGSDGPQTAAKPRIGVKAPDAVLAGRRATVRGTIRGTRRIRRVALQYRVGRRWKTIGRAKTRSRGRRFAFRWRTPSGRRVARLRVVAVAPRRYRRVRSPNVRLPIANASVLRVRRIASAPSPGQGGTVVVSGRNSIRSGEIIAAGIGAETPSGLLAKVTRVRRRSRTTVLSVRPASLVEAVPEGRISLGPESVGAASPRGKAAQSSSSFAQNMSCSTGVGAEVGGSAELSLDPALELEWGFLRVKKARAVANLTGSAELHASVDGQASCALSPTAVASWSPRPITFQLGPIPVVIVPQTTIYLSGEAEVSGSASTRVGGSIAATAGLESNGETVTPISGFTQTFAWQPPTQRIDGTLAGRITPSVSFLLYGVAGPRFDVTAGLDLGVTSQSAPWWRLTLPISLSGRLAVPHFPQFDVGPVDIYSTEIELANSGRPEAGSERPVYPERARMVWDTDETDVDLHVWDEDGNHAWFRDQEGIPDGTLSLDITTGFGPEVFTDEDPEAERQFTYGICYYDDEGVGPTNVTVGITDPDGTERTFEERLHETGDSSLLGSSPPGEGFDPDAGWCRS